MRNHGSGIAHQTLSLEQEDQICLPVEGMNEHQQTAYEGITLEL